MKHKPLAIDLFCGLGHSRPLGEAKLFLRANAMIEELVAGRAENPNHMPLRVRGESSCAPALKARLVREFNDPAFATGFASGRQVRMLPAQSGNPRILIRSSGVVDFLRFRLADMESTALLAGGLAGAIFRAVATVCIRRRDVEMAAAAKAVSASFRNVRLLPAPTATGATSAWRRAVALVGPHRHELSSTFGAKQIVHGRPIT